MHWQTAHTRVFDGKNCSEPKELRDIKIIIVADKDDCYS